MFERRLRGLVPIIELSLVIVKGGRHLYSPPRLLSVYDALYLIQPSWLAFSCYSKQLGLTLSKLALYFLRLSAYKP